MKAEKVICKVENGSTKQQSILLLFPEREANPGNIQYWNAADGHGECSMGYFWSLKNPSDEAACAAIHRYEQLHQTCCVRVLRDSLSMRTNRWKQRFAA
jgi:hypothetical protein